MILHKPVILIGLLHESDKRYHEIAWGIEEERCLYETYIMEDCDDIRYSITETTVLLLENKGRLYVNDLNKNNCLLSVSGYKSQDYRTLGKNAARYLKKMKLCL